MIGRRGRSAPSVDSVVVLLDPLPLRAPGLGVGRETSEEVHGVLVLDVLEDHGLSGLDQLGVLRAAERGHGPRLVAAPGVSSDVSDGR